MPGLFLRRGRTGEHELALIIRPIHGITHRIPQLRRFLPFINKTRLASCKEKRGLCVRKDLIVIALIRILHEDGALCLLLGSGRLPAPLQTPYRNSTSIGQTLC